LNRHVVVAALCGALAAPAVAQNQPAAGPQRSSGLSDREKLERSAENLAQMKGSLRAVLSRVEEARNEKDVVKLNCVNEKLTQIKGLLKVAEQSDVALHEAIANKDPAGETEFAKIGIARSKVEGLRGDADQCIGQLAYIVDEKTTVEVQTPDDLPEGRGDGRDRDDDRGRGHHHGPPVVRPPPASRFQ
jgi:TolA-binding protein